MKLTRLAGECGEGRSCPTVYTTDRSTVIVQGYVIPADELARIALPQGESAVEIPLSLLQEAARAHGS